MDSQTTRISSARNLAADLLADIELHPTAISSILLKAQRLSRLLRDQDAQEWLRLEINGYPSKFKFSSLGTCQKYAESGGRINSDTNKYLLESLPVLEARMLAAEQIVKTAGLPLIDKPIENFLVANATEKLLAVAQNAINQRHQEHREACGRFLSIKSSIHTYVTEVYHALELGDVAENIFESARAVVDQFVRTTCPKAAEQLVAMTERLKIDDLESRSAALNACRRLLATVADSVFPPQDEPIVDSKGKQRKVGADAYKNRLLAYLESKIRSGSTKSVIESQLEHLVARLDAVYEKSCKGVHDDVDLNEARLTIIQTWLFLAEVARYNQIKG